MEEKNKRKHRIYNDKPSIAERMLRMIERPKGKSRTQDKYNETARRVRHAIGVE